MSNGFEDGDGWYLKDRAYQNINDSGSVGWVFSRKRKCQDASVRAVLSLRVSF
jgi:hypothetical protein